MPLRPLNQTSQHKGLIDFMSVKTSIQQLPLGMWLRQGASLDSFCGRENQQLLQSLRQLTEVNDERFLFLWGAEGLGKSHLLQAVCHVATACGDSSVYLSMRQAGQFAPEMLDGLEQMSVVAIDDVDAIAGSQAWETALFNLYNRVRDNGTGSLVLAARAPLADLGLVLPDLRSRLSWGLVYQVQAMTDDEKLQALKQRADSRGFDLPDEVAAYLLRHYQRQTAQLFDLLERLDQHSLAEQRRLTIPFVKQVIESEE